MRQDEGLDHEHSLRVFDEQQQALDQFEVDAGKEGNEGSLSSQGV